MIYWFARLASNDEVALFIWRSMLVIVLEVGRARRQSGELMAEAPFLVALIFAISHGLVGIRRPL